MVAGKFQKDSKPVRIFLGFSAYGECYTANKAQFNQSNNVNLLGEGKTMPRELATLILIVGLSIQQAADACSCLPFEGTPDQQVAHAYHEATAVFLADVTDVSIAIDGTSHIQEANLRVVRRWKGPHPVSSIVTTTTIIDCCVCGLILVKGSRMLLYLSRNGSDRYAVSECSRTAPADQSASDISILDEILIHQTVTGLHPTTQSTGRRENTSGASR